MAGPSVLETMQRYAVLGPDFLTWLCVSSIRESLPPPPSEPGLEVSILGPMVFTSEHGEATKITMSGDEAVAAPEVLAALRQGKRLIRTKLQFTALDSTWVFTLDGETFDFRAMKLPVPKIPDLNEYMTMRVQATQRLAFLVGELFEQFLILRLEPPRWREEVEGWREIA